MSASDNKRKTLVGAIHPDVLAFTVGRDPELDLHLLDWDCLGSAAHVTMLSRMRIQPTLFTAVERAAVVAELAAIMRAGRAGAFAISQEDQDVHLAVERRLTEKLGDLGKRIHTGRSRNDQVAVDLRLHARDNLLGVCDECVALARALLAFARRHRDVPMVGRTHLQPAMPSSVGLWASGYAEGLLDDLLTVEAAYAYADRCPLGSAAGYGVPLPIDRRLTADLLGFAAPIHNVFHASNTRGKCESIVLGALAQIMLTSSRLAEDLILFTMPEFGYFALPPELCTGSSIMPQKYNPDVLELIRAKTARVLGHQTAVGAILKAMPGGYNRDLQETKELYLDGVAVTRATLRILHLMTQGLTVRPDRLRAGFGPGVFATDRALELVASGVPFREAYSRVRGSLDTLAGADPDAAIAAKRHLGGTAGLDLDGLAARAEAIRRETRRRRRIAHAAFSRLLHVDFQTLTPRAGPRQQGA
ncbi:MAG: argininosuccinate lyase [Lentisphaerae bacterium]|nr:argininosuccinate lyase [Lentisphaerota bacterium]